MYTVDIAEVYAAFKKYPEAGLLIDFDPTKEYKKFRNGTKFYPIKTIGIDGTYKRVSYTWSVFSFATINEAGKKIPTAPLINSYGINDPQGTTDNENGLVLTLLFSNAPKEFGEFFLEFGVQFKKALLACIAKYPKFKIDMNTFVPTVRLVHGPKSEKSGEAIEPEYRRIMPKFKPGTRKVGNRELPYFVMQDFNAVNPKTGVCDGTAPATILNETTGKYETCTTDNIHKFISGGEKIYAMQLDMASLCVGSVRTSAPMTVECVACDFESASQQNDGIAADLRQLREMIPIVNNPTRPESGSSQCDAMTPPPLLSNKEPQQDNTTPADKRSGKPTAALANALSKVSDL